MWNEWASESVFIDHKPSHAEMLELMVKNHWKSTFVPVEIKTVDQFIARYIHVEQLQRFYVSPKCCKCSGNGYYSFSTNPSVKCTDCNGTGRLSTTRDPEGSGLARL